MDEPINFNVHDPLIEMGVVYGIFRNGQGLNIHNRIYAEIIANYMTSKLLTSGRGPIAEIADPYLLPGNVLNMEKILVKFQEYMREQHSKKDRDFIERNGRLVFLAFLKPIINGKGYAFKEPEISEERRLDIAVTFLQHRYAVELKVWRGEVSHEKGLTQLSDYLDRQNLQEGYLVIFAGKKRWFAIPDGTTIAFDGDGDLDLPVGSVVAKEFTLGGKRIETRLFVRHQDGDWAGYSYEWNDAQTDATYVPGGKTKQIEGQPWLYPSRAQCFRCHTEQAGRTLGLEFGQLNGLQTYPLGVTAHQITTLDKIGMFAAPLPAAVEELPRLPDPLGADPLESRAKSYLHTNCSFCHQPGGTV